MRGLAYAVAVIAAVGIMIGISSLPSETPEPSAPEAAASVVAAKPMSEPGTLTLSVPTMHCEFACYPRVKEALEGAEAVKLVQLAPQQDEGTIDNRQVIVDYDAGFDLTKALDALHKEGFADSQVVQ